jgi:integrase
MLALRPMGIQNRLIETRSSQPAMVLRMVLNSDSPEPAKPTGRIAARALTDAAIRALRDGESRTDGSLPVGAGRLMIECVKVRGVLHRRWVFRHRFGNSVGKLRLGDYPAVGLDEARNKARVHIEQVRQGIDPRIAAFEHKQAVVKAQREKAALGSLRALLASYVAWLRASGKSSAREVELLFSRHVLGPWPQLASMPARAITPEMMRDVLARMIKAGIGRQTNIARSYLNAAFVHGAHADLDPRRAAAQASTFRLTSNPIQLLPRIAEFESARDRVLIDEELRQLSVTLEKRQDELGATIRCILLLGGQRFRQILRVKFSDYDRQRSTLRLIDPKGKRRKAVEHVLPVSQKVARELETLVVTNASGFIFSTTGGEKPIHHTTISAEIGAIAKVSSAAGSAYKPGDIRRTAETRLQALGVSRDVRAQLLSHGRTSGVQARHYERYDFLPEKRAALGLWEEHLASIVADQVKTPTQRNRATVAVRAALEGVADLA